MASRPPSGASRPVHVALLRGINVGGKHPVPMPELAALFAGAGCGDVRTYIQSGNVIFRADAALAARLPALAAEAIRERFGFPVPVVLRRADELAAAAAANPFLAEGAEPKALHVAFLADAPAPAAVAGLEPDRSPPDRFLVVGREVYLHCPNGVARTRLTTAWLDSRLATVSTLRNWRTVLTLARMAAE